MNATRVGSISAVQHRSLAATADHHDLLNATVFLHEFDLRFAMRLGDDRRRFVRLGQRVGKKGPELISRRDATADGGSEGA